MGGLLSLLGGGSFLTKTSRGRGHVFLTPIRPDTSPDPTQTFQFQYWPDQITDSKETLWVPREIPGGSLPLYQWVGAGARTIAFKAQFSCDMDLASSNTDFADLKSKGLDDRNVDIRSAVVWLRRYLLPAYGPNGSVGVPMTFAPPLLYLQFTGLGSIGLGGGESAIQPNSAEGLYCLMLRCDVTYTAWFTSGVPRLAEIDLEFAQCAQLGSSVFFPNRGTANAAGKVTPGQMDEAAFSGSAKQYFSYTLRGSSQAT